MTPRFRMGKRKIELLRVLDQNCLFFVDIQKTFPDVPRTTLEFAIDSLLKQGLIEKRMRAITSKPYLDEYGELRVKQIGKKQALYATPRLFKERWETAEKILEEATEGLTKVMREFKELKERNERERTTQSS